VRVTGRQRAVVTGVHGLEHRKGLTTTDLTDDDALRAHTEGVLHEIHDRDLAFAFDVRRAGLQADHVILHQAELRGVLDRDDPFVLSNEAGPYAAARRLAGAG